MGTFLMGSFLVLTALSSSCAAENRPLACEEATLEVLQDLAGIHRGAGEALKEMAQTQRKVDQCQTLASTKLDKLEERIDHVLDTSLALNRPVEGRFQDLEAKVDTQVDKLDSRLQAIEDRLNAMQVDTQANKANQLEANHTNHKKELEPIKDTLKAMQEQLTKVASRLACQPPFERVGGDCVHFHGVEMSWADARRYCQGLGGDLVEPADKTGFAIGGSHPMSDPHPPLFDFLDRKRKSLNMGRWFRAWVGASVDGDFKATWTSGQTLPGTGRAVKRLDCISLEVHGGGRFALGAHVCSGNHYPLCH